VQLVQKKSLRFRQRGIEIKPTHLDVNIVFELITSDNVRALSFSLVINLTFKTFFAEYGQYSITAPRLHGLRVPYL
jgi:hypothetical protein